MKWLICFLGIASQSTGGQATWSIVAVDPATGEVGSAGASCTPNVAGIARLVPGHGAIVAQAASNMEAKAIGARMIARGQSPAKIIASITNASFDPEAASQQYGIAVLGANRAVTATFSGRSIPLHRREISAPTYAVVGNTLVSAKVIEQSAAAFDAAQRGGAPLAERLMRALEAGSKAGGDRRCGAKTAQSAYLGVARRSDRPGNISLRIIVTGNDDDRRNPVAEVRLKLDSTR